MTTTGTWFHKDMTIELYMFNQVVKEEKVEKNR